MPAAEIRGVSFYYELSGQGSETIAFLNGIAMSVAHWAPYVQAFQGEYRCLCHDMRGQTLSGKPEGEYSLDLHAQDLAELMERLGITRVHLVGTSYGAEVAMAFAVRYPEKCLSLTLIDGVSETDPLLEAIVDSWILAAEKDARLFYRTILPWNYSPGYISTNRELLAKREAGVANLPRDWFEGFIRLCEAFLKINLTEALSAIQCPTLIMVGEKDILKPYKFSKIIQQRIKGSQLFILPGAGHAAVLEEPALIQQHLRNFLAAR
ncbi:MAG: alpha/beta hydrolase [Spirochaetia bacterium]|nr:alpha/beta hydrolase [Spirochaetia bacterium]